MTDEPADKSPIAAPPRGRGGFWEQTDRKRRDRNRFYTRIVRSLRFILPLFATGVVALLMAWPRVRDTVATLPKDTLAPVPAVGKNELINPRYDGRDGNLRPYEVTADHAIQSPNDPKLVLLDKPKGRLALADPDSIAGAADSGTYNQADSKLNLSGHVTLTHSLGYAMTTEKLLVDIKTQTAVSDLPVHGNGPAGTIEATGIKVDHNAGILIFTGPAHLVLTHGMSSVKGM
jgi:lipopolysaccharide export system protein LptC